MINSFELVQKLKNVNVPDNFVLASLDVVSLFTNIPKEAAISAVNSRWEEIRRTVSMPWNNFEEGLRLCLDSTDFNFNGTTYFQKRGLPMGSPFSPVLADIVMDDLEKDRLLNLDFEVPVYFRYVDDIFIVVRNTHIDDIVQIFNTNPLNIEFILEKEFNGAINFLDVTITRKQKKIIYGVPCKGNDCKAVYIGQTKLFLKNRLKNTKTTLKKAQINNIRLQNTQLRKIIFLISIEPEF